MAGPDPAIGVSPNSRRSNLALRVISSALLAPLTILVAWVGGLPFVAFWTIAASIVLWEWTGLVKGPRAPERSARLRAGWSRA